VGAPADLIITTPKSIDDLVKAGRVVAGGCVDHSSMPLFDHLVGNCE
jgi:hypothetical protein